MIQTEKTGTKGRRPSFPSPPSLPPPPALLLLFFGKWCCVGDAADDPFIFSFFCVCVRWGRTNVFMLCLGFYLNPKHLSRSMDSTLWRPKSENQKWRLPLSIRIYPKDDTHTQSRRCKRSIVSLPRRRRLRDLSTLRERFPVVQLCAF